MKKNPEKKEKFRRIELNLERLLRLTGVTDEMLAEQGMTLAEYEQKIRKKAERLMKLIE